MRKRQSSSFLCSSNSSIRSSNKNSVSSRCRFTIWSQLNRFTKHCKHIHSITLFSDLSLSNLNPVSYRPSAVVISPVRFQDRGWNFWDSPPGGERNGRGRASLYYDLYRCFFAEDGCTLQHKMESHKFPKCDRRRRSHRMRRQCTNWKHDNAPTPGATKRRIWSATTTFHSLVFPNTSRPWDLPHLPETTRAEEEDRREKRARDGRRTDWGQLRNDVLY